MPSSVGKDFFVRLLEQLNIVSPSPTLRENHVDVSYSCDLASIYTRYEHVDFTQRARSRQCRIQVQLSKSQMLRSCTDT